MKFFTRNILNGHHMYTLPGHGEGASNCMLKVKVALVAANGRLHNAREEREQFDEANNQILEHFKVKEDELSRSMTLYRAEADVCDAFVNFLEDSWTFESSYIKQKQNQVK
ncbi:hypothetical protein T459_22789 [Capsicum annuum]|uniref:Uncharacterized protein n=1 Tax=Capsicum annuum TaxID=4072 RepID=A0A2G2YQM1_CAPAN|nr:hypothetical protein T459_22789 [Capsicum annuum]